jgi:hypothetical protein
VSVPLSGPTIVVAGHLRVAAADRETFLARSVTPLS